MDAQSNSQNQFNNWCDMWEKSQDLFQDEPTQSQGQTSPEKIDFFGQNHEEAEDEFEPGTLDYWTKIYAMSNNAGDAPDVTQFGVITENEEAPRPVKPNMTDKEIGDVVKSKSNSANPVPASSVGKDQDYKPSLANVYQLEQLHDMKVSLCELEGKLNASDALGKTAQGSKVQKQIDEMKKKIDELSDSLTPNFLQSYLS